MLKLKLQYFVLLMQRADSLEKTLMLEKIDGRKKKRATEAEMFGWHHRLNGYEFGQPLGHSEGQGGWSTAVHRAAKSQTQLGD